MKKLLIFLLILLVITAGGYLAWTRLEMSPENLSHIEIINTGDNTVNTYTLDLSSAENLFADLNGTSVSSVPDGDFQVYQLALYHDLWRTKKYQVFFTENEVYVQDLKTMKTTRTDNPRFFYSHEGFDGLYQYRNPPKVEWLSSSEKFLPQKERIQWSFQKRDKKWYDAVADYVENKQTGEIKASGESISFETDIQPDSIHLTIQDASGKTLMEQPLESTAIPLIQDDGIYHYRVRMEWNNDANPYRGTYDCEFDVVIDQPAVFQFSSKTVAQGGVITIRVRNANEDETPVLKQSLFSQFKLYKDGRDYVGYLPTGYATPPGKYDLEYGLEGETLTKDTVTIKDRDFHIQHLTIDPAVESSTRNDAAYAEYDKYFTPSRQASADTLYYSEPFVLPAVGRLSTEYGETRHVNGSPTSYRHSGLDIAAPTGTPVYAVNRGRVALAMYLTLTGNTVVIDHGQGLFSVYFHMDKLMTEQGKIVERGQQIGTVGSTGFSTGPHLHFTMSYFDLNIEPGYFLVGEPITYKNYKDYLK